MRAMPKGLPEFLDKSTLKRRCASAGIPPSRAGLLAPLADAISGDPALLALAWYLHWRILINPGSGVPWGCPPLDKKLGRREGLFHLLIALDWPELLARYHRKLGYPAAVTAETIREISSFESAHIFGQGRPGIYPHMCAWLSTYLVGPFVRLGRFEYQLREFHGEYTAFRRGRDGAVVALADNGAGVDKEGLLAGGPVKRAWTASFRKGRAFFRGNPVDPGRGRIIRRKTALSRREWRSVLGKGDTVLNIHIPFGGGMDWRKVVDSLKMARAFFTRHHRNRRIKAVVLTTWFMDPRLADILPPDANPVKLQRACYLCPSLPGPGGLWNVFQCHIADTPLGRLPARTRVQRAIIRFLMRGGIWHGGAMFILLEDIPALREGAYSSRFAGLAGELGLD